MDSQQLSQPKRRRLLQESGARAAAADGGTNPCSYEVKFTCCAFFDDPQFSDLRLSVNDGRLGFHVHRVVLATRSEVFRALFVDVGGQASELALSVDEEFESVFEAFLKFLYGSPVDVCKENLWLYYYLAEEYKVDDLTKACGAYLRENLQVTKRKRTDVMGLEAASWFSLREVVDVYEAFAIDVIKGYAAANLLARLDAMPDDLWMSLSKGCVCAVLAAETALVSERHLFQLATAWLEHEPDERAAASDELLSNIRYCHFAKPTELLEAQTHPLVASSARIVALVAAGCHYKFMKKELSSEEFAKLPEFRKKQYANRRYRRVEGGTRSTGTPPSSSGSTSAQ